MLISKFRKRFSRYPGHYFSHQGITGITIHKLVAGVEIQLLLLADKLQDMFGGNYIIQTPTSHCKQIPLVAQSACVVCKMSQRDFLAKVGDFGNEFSYIIVKRQFPFLLEQ